MTDALPTLSKGFRPNETTDMYHDDYDFERLFVGGRLYLGWDWGLTVSAILIPVCGLDEMNKHGDLGKLMNDESVGNGLA